MNTTLLKKYAALAVKMGVNIQKDDLLVINSPIDTADFARTLADEAYKLGAKDVIVHYSDSKLTKIKLTHSSTETLSDFPEWEAESINSYSRKGACFISISAADPDALKGVDMSKIAASQKARSIALKEHSSNAMSNKNRWCVIAMPTPAWAKKVFPNLSEDEAVENLLQTIYKTVRVDKEDPIVEWNNHNAYLNQKINFMNTNNFSKLFFKNSKGTDLTIELPQGHLWCGGGENDVNGILFNANMPTEEVFTLPKKTGVNGIVYSTKPLIYGGNQINEFSLTFKDGKVIEYTAKEGYEVLKTMLETDDGAKYLGEVALVPYDSPISNTNLVFYNTLFDENAACHLALGKAYSSCIKDSDLMSKEELESAGVNTSLIHEDFMIGSDDLIITGLNDKGETITIFSEGNWAF